MYGLLLNDNRHLSAGRRFAREHIDRSGNRFNCHCVAARDDAPLRSKPGTIRRGKQHNSNLFSGCERLSRRFNLRRILAQSLHADDKRVILICFIQFIQRRIRLAGLHIGHLAKGQLTRIGMRQAERQFFHGSACIEHFAGEIAIRQARNALAAGFLIERCMRGKIGLTGR